jgi:hypothetical protein
MGHKILFLLSRKTNRKTIWFLNMGKRPETQNFASLRNQPNLNQIVHTIPLFYCVQNKLLKKSER